MGIVWVCAIANLQGWSDVWELQLSNANFVFLNFKKTQRSQKVQIFYNLKLVSFK